MTNLEQVKVTIVTVVYNGERIIEKTIQSVLAQRYSNLEYLIIDGNSKDKTVDVIKKYVDKIDYWISEPDTGVYDAMNKAIERATGEWILFMNAGDYFYDEDVTSKIMATPQAKDPNIAILYGNAEFRLKNIRYILTAVREQNKSRYMPFSHQAVYTRTSIAKANKFDLEYKIVADSAFFLKLFKEGYKAQFIPEPVCSYNALDGLSVNHEYKRLKELMLLESRHNGVDINSVYVKQTLKEAKKRIMIKKIMPNWLKIYFQEKAIKEEFRGKWTSLEK